MEKPLPSQIGPSTIPNYSHSWKQQRIGIGILVIVYIVGVAGILLPIHPDFILLTPINLLFSTGMILYYHQPKDLILALFILTSFLTGYLFELIGVQTGLIFGDYQYGEVLGLKLWDTPLMIGVNWVMVTYSVGMTISLLFPDWSNWAKALASAAGMVLLDLIIEPVAMTRGFWTWEGDSIPLQNYAGWFFIGLGLQLFFHFRLRFRPNFVAVALLILQFLFFGILLLAG